MDEFEWFVVGEWVRCDYQGMGTRVAPPSEGLFAKGFQTEAQALTAAAELAKQNGRDVVIARRSFTAKLAVEIVTGVRAA